MKSTASDTYRKYIEKLEAASREPPLSPQEKKEIARLVREQGIDRAEAESQVIEDRQQEADQDNEWNEWRRMAAVRHRSYLPLVQAGLMTVYEAVREVGANRSADGCGQDRG